MCGLLALDVEGVAQVAYVQKNGLSVFERLVGYLPRYAPFVSNLSTVVNALNKVSLVRLLNEKCLGLSKKRALPHWSKEFFLTNQRFGPEEGIPVVLFADTFNTYHEPENLHAAVHVLVQLGCRVEVPKAKDNGRALCCGKTFLAAGLVDQANQEASRLVETYLPYIEAGFTIVGLEPSCTLALEDEVPSLLKTADAKLMAENTALFPEFVSKLLQAPANAALLKPLEHNKALLHGHCHEKAFTRTKATIDVLKKIPNLEAEMIESSCCGMAGAFGYHKDTFEISKAMGELSLLPAVRRSDLNTLIIANGTSCRHLISNGTDHSAKHLATVLLQSLTKFTEDKN